MASEKLAPHKYRSASTHHHMPASGLSARVRIIQDPGLGAGTLAKRCHERSTEVRCGRKGVDETGLFLWYVLCVCQRKVLEQNTCLQHSKVNQHVTTTSAQLVHLDPVTSMRLSHLCMPTSGHHQGILVWKAILLERAPVDPPIQDFDEASLDAGSYWKV